MKEFSGVMRQTIRSFNIPTSNIPGNFNFLGLFRSNSCPRPEAKIVLEYAT